MTECFKPLAQPSRYKAAYGGELREAPTWKAHLASPKSAGD